MTASAVRGGLSRPGRAPGCARSPLSIAEGALPGRQRAPARPGAGPAGAPRAERPGPGRRQRLLPRRPGRRARRRPGLRLGRAWPAGARHRRGDGEPARPGSRAGRCSSATPTRTWPRRRRPPTWRRCWTAGTARRYGCCACPPATGRPSSATCASPASRCCPPIGGRRPAAGAVRPGGRGVATGRASRPAGAHRRTTALYLDTGTPDDFLAANLHAAGAGSLVAPDATVTGEVEHAVVGSPAQVHGSAHPLRGLPRRSGRGRRAPRRRDPAGPPT